MPRPALESKETYIFMRTPAMVVIVKLSPRVPNLGLALPLFLQP